MKNENHKKWIFYKKKNFYSLYKATMETNIHNTHTQPAYNTREGAGLKNNRFRWAFIEIPNSKIKYYNDISTYLKKAKFNYYLAGYHIPNNISTVGKHIHIFIQWVNPKVQGEQFLKEIYYCHISPHQNYNPTAIINYIKCKDEKHKKENVNFELIEESGESKGCGKFPSIKEVKEMSKEQREELGPQYKNIVKEINENEIAAESFLNKIYNKKKQIEVLYLYGSGGIGKTQCAYMIMRDEIEDGKGCGIITFDDNGFANLESNYKDEPEKINVLLWNEFRDSNIKFNHFLQYLLNEKPYRILYNNVYLPNLEKIIITSSQAPEELYKNIANYENRAQLERRLTEVGTLDKWDYDEQEPENLQIDFGYKYFENIHKKQEYINEFILKN